MKKPHKEEGAALFIVLMIVMVGTASAVFSATTVSHEVRGTGFARQQMQTRYAARAGLTAAMDWFDIFGPETVRNIMLAPGSNEGVDFVCGNTAQGGTCYPEVPMANNRRAYRLYPEHFSTLTSASPPFLINLPYEQGASFGAHTALNPIVTVDIYDEHVLSKLAPGSAAQGGSKFKYLRTTLTARARARVPGDVTDTDDQNRQRNETGADYRAYIVSGPLSTGS
jgi:hypothetical protein